MEIDQLAKMLWDYNNLHHQPEKADCIVVLGSSDIRVAERGAQLFLAGFAPYILMSGGFGRLTGGWTEPEADVFCDQAVKMGVPKDKILIENTSTNTGENIANSVALLTAKHIRHDKLLVVTKPYMERRAFAVFAQQFPKISVVMASPQIAFEDYPNEVISRDDMINIMVGDTQRIKKYPAKGYMIAQAMPPQVWQAYEALVDQGFTKQLIKEL